LITKTRNIESKKSNLMKSKNLNLTTKTTKVKKK